MLRKELTDKIIHAFYKVYNTLGYGFLEKVYENAMMIELEKAGLTAVQQKNITVRYETHEIGYYYADILVENLVILELKAAPAMREEDEAQLINHLRATSIEVGLLFNFGKKPSFKRKIFENRLKK